MDKDSLKKGMLMSLKDRLESLNDEQLTAFLFEFIKEPMAYVIGRFSDSLDLKGSIEKAKSYTRGEIGDKELLREIDSVLQTIVRIEDPYDREILYSLSSAMLALIEREHAFDAILHDLDSIVLDVGFDDALSLIPERIKHHNDTIDSVLKKGDSEIKFTNNDSLYSRLIG